MAQEIASLYAAIGADTSSIEQSLKQTQEKIRQAAEALKGLGDTKIPQPKVPAPEVPQPPADPFRAFNSQLKDMATGALSAAAAMRGLRQVWDLTQLGASVLQQEATFTRLVGSAEKARATLEQLRAVTNGAADDTTLMSAASKFLVMGIAQTTDEAAKLVQMSTQLSMAMGGDATTAASDFALMLANQSLPRLDNFGISSGNVRRRIEELQAANAGMTRDVAFTKAVLEEGAKAMERVGDQTQGAAGKIATLGSAFSNLKANFGKVGASTSWFKELTGDAANAVQSVANYFGKLSEGRGVISSFESDLKTLRDSGAITNAEFKATENQVTSLFYRFEYGKMTTAELQASLAALAPAAMGISPALNQDAVALDVFRMSADAAMVSMQSFAASVAAEAQKVGDSLASGIKSEAFQSSLASIQQAIAQNGQAMAAIQQSNTQALMDLQFNYNLERLKAEQQYQAQHTAYLEAGRVDDAAKLTQKFQNEQQMAAANYDIQQQLQARTLLIQQVQQQRSYIQQLAVQKDAAVKSLIAQIEKAKSENTISAETARAAIDIAATQGSEQLRLEIETARRSLEVASQWASGQIDARKMVILAMEAVNNAQTDAASALSNLEAQLAGFQIELPPMPALDMSEIGGGAAAAAIGAATEPATRALSEVATDIEKGIAAAKNAIKELAKFEIPAGVDQGLDRVGEFFTLSVGKFYDYILPAKPKIEGIKDELPTLNDLAQLITALAQGMAAINTEQAAPDMSVWADRLVVTLDYATNALDYAKQLIGEDKIKAQTEIIEPFKSILSIVGTDFSKLALAAEFPDMAEWGNRFILVMQYGANAIDYAAKVIGPQTLASASDLSEQFGNVASVVTTDFSKLSNAKTFPDMALWADRTVVAVEYGVAALQLARQKLGADGLKEAAEVAGSAREVLGILSIDLTTKNTPGAGFQAAVQNQLALLSAAVDVIVPLLRATRERYTGEVLTEAADTARALGDVVSVLNLGETFTKAAEGGMPTNKPGRHFVPKRSFEVIIESLREGIDYLVPQLQQIDAQYGEALAQVQGTVANVQAVFEAMGSIASAQTEIANGEWDFSFLRSLLQELGGLFGSGALGALPQPQSPPPAWAGGDTTGPQGDAGRIRVELTMRLDEDMVPTITAHVLEAVGTAQNLYIVAGNEGAL